MRILAFDQATKCGWALGETSQQYQFGRWEMPKRPPPERLGWLYRKMVDKIDSCKPDLVSYELPWMPDPQRLASTWDVIQWAQKIEALVMLAADQCSVPVEAVAAATWRKTVCGFARAPKETPAKDKTKFMKRAVKNRIIAMGYDVRNDDESDALGILHHFLTGAPASDRAQGDIFAMAEEDL